MTLDEIKRRAVMAALARHRGHKVNTARELEISLKGLYNLLALYRRQGHVTDEWLASLYATNATASTNASTNAAEVPANVTC